MKLHYFGTDLHSAGHYFFDVTETSHCSNRNIRFEKLPFNPESLPYGFTHTTGVRKDYHAFGFTILAISGSVVDKRGGCKSIFFVEEEIPFDEMEKLVRATRFGKTVYDSLINELNKQR